MAVVTTVAVAAVVAGQILRWAGDPLLAGTVEAGGSLITKYWPGKGVPDARARILAQLGPHSPDPESADWLDAEEAAARALGHLGLDPYEVVADLRAVKLSLVPRTDLERERLRPEARRWFDLLIDASLHVLHDAALANPQFLKNAAARQLRDHADLLADHARHDDQLAALPQHVWEVSAAPLVERYLARWVEPLAISDPARRAERVQMDDFVSSRDDAWWWWTAQPWAGKTAFMADLAVRPPAGASVAVFLTIGGDATADDRGDFLDAVLPQLAVIAGRSVVDRVGAASPMDRLLQFHALLAEAADNCLRKQKRLLLLVDGLDEDKGTAGSIASSLPAILPAGVKVVVASRTLPALDVPYDHPLATSQHTRGLAPSPGAVARKQQAFDELDRLWRLGPNQLGRTLVCLAAAAEAPLTTIDLAELATLATNGLIDRPMIDHVLQNSAARVFDRVTQPGGDGYRVGHETLDDRIIENLAPRSPRRAAADDKWAQHRHHVLAPWRQHIHKWVDAFARNEWRFSETPNFVGEPYFQLVTKTRDLNRMTALATNLARHRFLRHLTGSNHAAYREMHAAAQGLRVQVPIDLPTLATLSVYLRAMSDRHGGLPTALFRAWVAIDRVEHALEIAGTITEPHSRAQALTSLVEALAHTDPERAEQVAAAITHPDSQTRALTSLVEALAPTDPERAERVVAAITGPFAQASALIALVEALVSTDPQHALELAHRAHGAVVAITDPYVKARTLTDLAEALAPVDPQHALEMTNRVEQIALSITDNGWQATALAGLVKALARTDPERAVELATRAEHLAAISTDPVPQDEALLGLVEALAPIDPDRAEQLVDAIVDPDVRTWALTAMVKALGLTNPERAEQLAATITDPQFRARALTALVDSIVSTDPQHALELARRAEQIVVATTEPFEQAHALSALVEALAGTAPQYALDLAERAEAVAITRDVPLLGLSLNALVRALASIDPERAERFVSTISDPDLNRSALTALGKALTPATLHGAEQMAVPITGGDALPTRALSALVEALAPNNFEGAERVTLTITDPGEQAWLLIALTMQPSYPINHPLHAEQVRQRALFTGHLLAAGRWIECLSVLGLVSPDALHAAASAFASIFNLRSSQPRPHGGSNESVVSKGPRCKSGETRGRKDRTAAERGADRSGAGGAGALIS